MAEANDSVTVTFPTWVATVIQEVMLEEYEALVRQRGDNGDDAPNLREEGLDQATDLLAPVLPDIEERSRLILSLSVQRGELS
jgi:hypothetical protein